MATHSSILAWRILMDVGAWPTIVYGITESDMTEQLSTVFHCIYIYVCVCVCNIHSYIHSLVIVHSFLICTLSTYSLYVRFSTM